MSLVNPTALLLAGLALPIIVFYILKIRLRRVPVSTLLFWQQIFEEKKPRSLWQRLRHLLSLLLQLAFLAFLVFALADPIFRWQQAQARRLVLVVDNSASMNASDVRPSRLEAAKAEGRRLIDGMRLGDELAIIAAGAAAAGRLRADRPPAHASRRPRFDHAERRTDPRRPRPSRWRGGCSPAPRRCAGSSCSPTAASTAPPSSPAQENVELIPIGKKTGNVGITRLQARRSLLDPIGYEILVEVVERLGRARVVPARARPGRRPDRRRAAEPRGRRAHRAGLREDLGRRRPAARARSTAPIPCRPTTPPGRSCPAALARR